MKSCVRLAWPKAWSILQGKVDVDDAGHGGTVPKYANPDGMKILGAFRMIKRSTL